MQNIEEVIDQKIGEVRTEAFDMSFGEIVNLHQNKELVIQPEYQRLFRWTDEQKSRLVESILLELPIPEIFVIENPDGVIELIDGLQRVSSIIQFINPAVIEMDPLQLTGCDLIEALNGIKFEDLPLSLRLRIKRSSVRTIVIKKQSRSFLRYEMFKRLNTGGANLSSQEIRNCSARMLGEEGVKFYGFLQELAGLQDFKGCTESISPTDYEQKGNEELVLRFFAAKNGDELFRGSVRDWLDDYMENVLLAKINFDYETEREQFQETFSLINRYLSSGAFVKYRGGAPIGALAPAYYEAVTIAFFRQRKALPSLNVEAVRRKIADVVESAAFRGFTGPGANSRPKLLGRIATIEQAILEITP